MCSDVSSAISAGLEVLREKQADESAEHKASRLNQMTRSMNHWVGNFVTHHTTTEWLVGLAIILTWAVVAFASIGPVAALAAVLSAVVLHYVAMETGSHIWLWIATTVMLVFVIVAYNTVLDRLGPTSLAIGGAMALAYNEAVRLSYNRRRDAVVDSGVFIGSVIALVVATVVGIGGVGLSLLLTSQPERSWVWMPAAVLVLMIVSYAVVLLPTRQLSQTNQQRWEPGTRIPPQPIEAQNRATSIAPPPPPPPPPTS